MKTIVVFVCLFALCCAMSVAPNRNKIDVVAVPDKNTSMDLCIPCVEFMDDNLNALVQIVNAEETYTSCSSLCSQLNKSIDVIASCITVCELIGISPFWKVFERPNVDPIWACQLVNACVVTKSPSAKFDNVIVTPGSSNAGATFYFAMKFSVVNETGVGQIVYVVYPPGDAMHNFIKSQTFENYTPGSYATTMTFPTTKNSTYIAGHYRVSITMCSGECAAFVTNPAVVILSHESASFNITQFGA